ncbi:MAG: hypothetical protein GY790_19345 [Bacteroidetes bacterium]|nr:hypothetical protein [Bacteroidota bacterium]
MKQEFQSLFKRGTKKNAGIKEYFEENLPTPKNSSIWGIEGAVVIRFKVLPTGNLSEFEVINSLTPDYNNAVIAKLEATDGMWCPGTNNGCPMPMSIHC